MHVTHVMASAAAGGGATYLKWLLPSLLEHGVQSTLITGKNGSLAAELQDQGFTTHQLDLMRSRVSPRQALRLRRQIVSCAPEIVHAHGTRAAFYCSTAGIAKRHPVVYTAHGIAFRESQSLFRQQMMRAAEWVATRRLAGLASVSRADLRSLQDLGEMPNTALQYIPNPVDTQAYKPGDQQQARQLLGLPSEGFMIGTVSRLVEQKAVDVLIRSVAGLPNTTLVIVGTGPLEGKLKKLATKLEVNCLFVGERDDVANILPAFDVFALSSLWEGEPLSLLEAMACGLACVASDTPGARDILENGAAGSLFPLGDSGSLGKILRNHQDNAAYRHKMAADARLAAQQRTVKQVARMTFELYQECR